MPVRIWTHLCDYANIDANGKASIIGEFDRIFAQTMPVGHPIFFVISKWNGLGNETFNHRVRILSPSGREIAASQENHVTIPVTNNGEGNHITADAFLMIGFPEFGEYAVEILLNGNPVHILPLNITPMSVNLSMHP